MQANVLEYLTATLERTPDRAAVFDGTTRLTFQELSDRARTLAARIAVFSDATNQPVAMFLPKGCDQLVALVGILHSGNCYVPLDVNSPAPRLAAILADLRPACVVTDRRHADRLPAGTHPLVLEDEPVAGVNPASAVERWTQRIDTDPVYIMYTSGSTGTPKGVVIPHRGVIDHIDWAKSFFALDGSAVIGNQSPFNFDMSTLDIYLCLALGATLVLIPEQLFIFPAKLVEFLQDQKVSLIYWVPSLMANIANLRLLDKLQLPGLNHVLFAGEVISNKHLNYWRRRVPNAVYANLFGPTEITDTCTCYVVDREFQDDEPLPIGRACRNSGIQMLNEHNRLVVEGEVGELCVRGSCLALGYWNDVEKTSGAFVSNPLNPHYPDRTYRTGDLAYYNERGEIMFAGRKDQQVKHMGYRVELGEIEHAALAVKGLGNACVLYDRSRKEIVLFYEAASEVGPAVIRQELSRTLPKYMLPTAFHRLDLLPTNPNGKADRQSLANTFLGTVTEANRSARTPNRRRTPCSMTLLDRVHKALNEIRPEADFSHSSNFVSDGLLDSLDVLVLVASLEQTLSVSIDGHEIVPENFRNAQTIQALLRKHGVAA
jgi:amino acid adenylation domain-containing protein